MLRLTFIFRNPQSAEDETQFEKNPSKCLKSSTIQYNLTDYCFQVNVKKSFQRFKLSIVLHLPLARQCVSNREQIERAVSGCNVILKRIS